MKYETKKEDEAISAGIIYMLKKRKLRVLVYALATLAFTALTSLLLLHLPPIQKKILHRVLYEANSNLSSQITVQGFRWIPSSSLSLTKLSARQNNRTVARIEKIVISYSFQFKWPEIIKIKQVRLIAPRLFINQAPDGSWNLPTLQRRKPEKKSNIKKKKTETAENSFSWEFLVPERMVIEDGTVRTEKISKDAKHGEIYDFKSINAVLGCTLRKVNGTYQADFNLERASFYQTRPGLGLVVSEGQVVLRNGELIIKKLNVNVGSSPVKLLGKFSFSPDFRASITCEVRNLTPSKVALFIPSWPLRRNLNSDITISGTDKSFLFMGSAYWGKSSLSGTGNVDISTAKQTKISLIAFFKHLNTEDISLPVSSDLSGKLKVDLAGRNIQNATGKVECYLKNSLLEGKEITTATLSCELKKGLVELSHLKVAGKEGILTATGRLNNFLVKGNEHRNRKKSAEFKGSVSEFNPEKLLPGKNLPEANINFDFDLALATRNEVKETRPPLWKQWNGTCSLKLEKSTWENVRISGGAVKVALSKGVLKLKHVEIKTEKGFLIASGNVILPENLDIKYNTDIRDLALFSKLVPWHPFNGAVKSSGEIKGNLNKPSWEGHFYAENFKIDRYAAQVVRVAGKSSLSLDTGKRILDMNTTELSVDGRRINSIILHIEQEDGKFRAEGIMAFNEGQSKLNFSVESPDIFAADKTFTIPSLTLSDKTARWRLSDKGLVKYSRARLLVNSLKFEHLNEQISVQGFLNRDETCEFEIGLKNIDIEKFGKLIGRSFPLTGKLNASFALKGSLQEPAIHANGKIKSLQFEDVNLKPLLFELDLENQNLSWNIRLENKKGVAEEFRGNLALYVDLKGRRIGFPNNKLSGKIRGEHIDLSSLKEFQPRVEKISGILNLNMDISGKKDDPRIEGSASLENATLKLKSWQRSFTDVNVFCKLHTRGIDIIRARGMWGGGQISFRGWIPYPFGKSRILNLAAKLENVTLPIVYGIHSRVNADLHLGGDRFNPDFTGKVKINKAVIMLDELMSDSDSDIEVIDNPPKEGKTKPSFSPENSFFRNLSMNLNILVEPGHAWLNGKGINAELAGNLILRKKPRRSVVVQGKLNTVRGAYNLQGKIFHVIEGTIVFNGLSPPDPNLHVICEYRVGEVNIYAVLKGSVSRMQLDLASEPPMEKVDILAYILYGHPASKLSSKEASSLGDEALALVGNKVAGLLKNKILPDSPWVPDVLTYKSGANEDEGGVVMIGKYITPDLFVDVEKGTSSSVNDQMKIEYKINKHFSIESQIGDEANSGVDVFWRYDFGD